ncbi:MAG: MBL fold metallo-hydrolase [Gammaproteobacteria bacterium]
MRFASLGSGSKGNATLIENETTCVMVDCGFSCVEVEKRLQRLGRQSKDVDAILVTHEHSDHIAGVARFSRKFDVPVWATAGTLSAKQADGVTNAQLINSHVGFSIGDIHIQPFPVPHDAREPCQFVFTDGGVQLGILTDIGMITPHVIQTLGGIDALILECNHDPKMLQQGPYPHALKQRVGGHFGHLNNAQAAKLLDSMDTSKLRMLVLAHLSDKNNHPELAMDALNTSIDFDQIDITIACQKNGFDWHHI